MTITMTKILAFAASTRAGSFNQTAVEVAADGAREAGADVTLLALKDSPLPIFSEDLESADGLPENVLKLRSIFAEHDALLVASPEYNGFFTPLLKNTLDWLSRPAPDDSPSPFDGKLAALVSASPGGLGGVRGLPHAKLLLENLGILVLPHTHAVRSAPDVFGANDFAESRHAQGLRSLGRALAETVAKLRT
jgi:NAD(P)H-dependent FMN reductase